MRNNIVIKMTRQSLITEMASVISAFKFILSVSEDCANLFSGACNHCCAVLQLEKSRVSQYESRCSAKSPFEMSEREKSLQALERVSYSSRRLQKRVLSEDFRFASVNSADSG